MAQSPSLIRQAHNDRQGGGASAGAAGDGGGDLRLASPSVARNRDPLLKVLRPVLPETGRVLEIASGSGEHAVHIARAIPGLIWQPTDPDARARDSITAWTADLGLKNILPPLDLDARLDIWTVEGPFDVMLCVNMIHIAPWSAAEGVVKGARRHIAAGGQLIFYGPFKREGQHTAPSNEAFDLSLRSRDPEWGVRDLDAVTALAREAGLTLDQVIEMPANNLTVVYKA